MNQTASDMIKDTTRTFRLKLIDTPAVMPSPGLGSEAIHGPSGHLLNVI